jgi:hypothetical protein
VLSCQELLNRNFALLINGISVYLYYLVPKSHYKKTQQLDKVSNFSNDALIFADFLKKTCRLILVAQGRNPSPGKEKREENRGEQRGPAVFPLLFFPRGRIRSTRREKKNQHLIKNRQKSAYH